MHSGQRCREITGSSSNESFWMSVDSRWHVDGHHMVARKLILGQLVNDLLQWHTWLISVTMFLNAWSVLVESKADISMKDRLLISTKARVSSGTCSAGDFCCPRHDDSCCLYCPTSSFTLCSTILYIMSLAVSHTSSAPTMPG